MPAPMPLTKPWWMFSWWPSSSRRSISRSCSSYSDRNNADAVSEYTAKFTPSAVTVAPSAAGLPPWGTRTGFTSGGWLSNNGRGISTGALAESRELFGKLDERFEGGLGSEVVLSTGRLISFKIEPQRCPDGPGSTQPEDDPAAIGKADANPLLAGDRSIHRIVVGKVVGIGNPEAAKALADEVGQPGTQVADQLAGNGAVDLLIIVAGIVVAAIGRPVVLDDGVDILPARREDVEPQQDRPQAVFLAHVVGAGAGAFLAADGNPAGVEQVAEEFPASRRLVHFNAELFRHTVGGGAGRHGPGDAGESFVVAGRQVRVGGKQRE